MSDKKIPIGDASNNQLRHYAANVLGLDNVKNGQSTAHIRGLIEQAMPGIEEIDVTGMGGDAVDGAPEPTAKTLGPVGNNPNAAHFSNDPRVDITVMESSDPTKPTEVLVSANGDTIQLKRGERVSIPYRFYRTMLDALEVVPKDTGEINPVTGAPLVIHIEQQSYHVQVHSLPSDKQIAAWMERVANVELGKAA